MLSVAVAAMFSSFLVAPVARQQVTVELFYDGAWHDITADDDVLASDPITITRGQGDVSPALRPSTVSMRLANDDDRYRVSNPMSPLSGAAGRNTPARVKVNGTIRVVAGAASWRAGQTADFRRYPRRGSAWVDLQCSGLAQQVNQWTQKLRSPLRRAVDLSGVAPVDYWPMEDPAGSTSAASANGGTPMTPVSEVRYTLPDGSPLAPGGAPEFGRGAGVQGADLLPTFQGGGTLRAPVRSATYDGYAIDWVMQLPATASPTPFYALEWFETGTYKRFQVEATSGAVNVFHSNAADLATETFTGSAQILQNPFDGIAHHYRYQVRQSGGNYSATLYIDGGTALGVANNFVPPMAGTVGRPTSIDWNPGEDDHASMPMAAGHLVVWPSGQLGDQPATFTALNGNTGERASYRLGRILDEQGISYLVSTSFNDSTPMGPQRPNTLADLLREIISTEDALLYDSRESRTLLFKSRADRYNGTVVLALYPEDLPFLPEEVTDDLEPANVVTAAQREGGDFTARRDVGSMSTQDPPDGIGEYQKRVDVNVADESADLPQQANWWLNRGTVDLPRFPRVVVNVAALPADRVAAVEAVDIGDVITITGYRPDVIRLHVLGYVEVIGNGRNGPTRMITFNCASDLIFDVGTYNTRRYDLRTCTLAAAVSPTATTLQLAITADEAWSSTTAYDLMIGGEKVRVPSGGMGARGGVPGAYTQTLTGALRSRNGVLKTLPAGESVHVAVSGRYAL